MEAHQDNHIMFMEETKSHMNIIIKRKRTKRQKPSSPLTTLTMASPTSSTTAATVVAGAPANLGGFFEIPTNSIEFTNNIHENNDEDMANCLILLAHGHHTPPPPRPRLYVYECKTCNRGFSSFQALGGHRASHKKPYMDLQELSKNGNPLLVNPIQALPCNPNGTGSTRGSKVHECSICGAEFASGQALGGHMRRHRSMPMATTVVAATAIATTACNTFDRCREFKKQKTLLGLDLNLPAPIEDDHDHKETEFSLGSNKQVIVFSTNSLVDCHF